MHLSKTTTILIIALIATVGIAALVLMNAAKTPSDEEIVSEGQMASEDEVVFLNLASRIDTISFDAEFLNDPRLLSLEDIRVAVIPEEIGRRDPFAALIGLPQAR